MEPPISTVRHHTYKRAKQMQSWGDVMKKSALFLISLCSLSLLDACGGGGSSSGGGGNDTHFSLTAPATVSAGTNFSLTVTALDAMNNVATGYSGIVIFTSTDGQFGGYGGLMLTGGTGTIMLSERSTNTDRRSRHRRDVRSGRRAQHSPPPEIWGSNGHTTPQFC
jgi:hypothetical protein